MANIFSIIIGLFALLLAFVAFIPLLGWANWIILPMAALGALLGFISDRKSGMYFCIIVMAICALRLFLGGGIF